MKQTRWFGKSIATVLAAAALGVVACNGDNNNEDDDVLLPGGITVSGNLSAASTAGDNTLGGVIVIVRGDRDTQGSTDATGNFLVTNASTGNITVLFRRGACEAGFPLDNVTSRSELVLTNVSFPCTSAAPQQIGETIDAVLRDDPGPNPATPLDTCVRVGDDEQRREVAAGGATIFDPAGNPTSFDSFDGDDFLQATGTRSGIGPAGPLNASSVRILQRDAQDPCDDDPLG